MVECSVREVMKISKNSKCPCGSGKKYKECCYKYHKGANPPNALLLMKSRYSAYAAGDAKYIIKTHTRVLLILKKTKMSGLNLLKNLVKVNLKNWRFWILKRVKTKRL